MEIYREDYIEFSAEDREIIKQRAKEDIRATYQRNLRRILSENIDTEVGSRFGFDEILTASPRDTVVLFKRRIPVTDYPFWEGYIERVMAGETNILSSKRAVAILTTGGTSGASKYIPLFITDEMLQVNEDLFVDVKAQEELSHTINLVLPYSKENVARTPNGLPITGFSSLHGRELSGIPTEIPDFVNDIGDIFTIQFVKSLFFLRNDRVEIIESTYVNVLLSWLNFIRRNWTRLLDTLEHCDLDAVKGLKLTEAQRLEITALLQQKPGRIEVLRYMDPNGTQDGFVKRIWPNLREVSSCHAGPYFKAYEQEARRLLGAVALRNKRMASNEMGVFGLGLSNKHFILDTSMCNFFEFIEESQWDAEIPTTIHDFDQLEIGSRYDIVVTTDHSGLYRYRQRDIIRILGRASNGLPIFSYEGRIGASLSIGNCKILDVNFDEAFDYLSKSPLADRYRFVHYIVKRDEVSIPNQFVFYLESDERNMQDTQLATRAAEVLEDFFSTVNYSYRLYRMQNSVGRVLVKLVEPGTVQDFTAFKSTSQACSLNQVKFVPIISNESQADYFDRRVTAISEVD